MISILVLTSASSNGLFGQSPYEKLVFGSYSVGLQVIYEMDVTRPYQSIDRQQYGRPLQICVWYPSTDSSSTQSLSLYDYLKLKSQEPGVGYTDISQAKSDYFSWAVSEGGSREQATQFDLSSIKMRARHSLTPAPVDAPVFLLMHGSAIDFCFMAEYLASYGFIVVVVPSKGYLNKAFDVDGKGLESQIRDYEFALNVVKSRFQDARSDTVCVAGFSFGGQSALGFAIRQPSVSAVVSLDGGIGSSWGSRLLSSSPFYALEMIDRPILHLYNPADPYTDLNPVKGYVFSDRLLAGLRDCTHWHFTSFGLLNHLIPGLFGQENSSLPFEAILYLTKNFLEDPSLPPERLTEQSWVSDVLATLEKFRGLTKD